MTSGGAPKGEAFCTESRAPTSKAVTPLDPALGIEWQEPFIVSDKDRDAPLLAQVLK